LIQLGDDEQSPLYCRVLQNIFVLQLFIENRDFTD